MNQPLESCDKYNKVTPVTVATRLTLLGKLYL